MTLSQVFKTVRGWFEAQKDETEGTIDQQAEKRFCVSCGNHDELFVSREGQGTQCHKCAGLK